MGDWFSDNAPAGAPAAQPAAGGDWFSKNAPAQFGSPGDYVPDAQAEAARTLQKHLPAELRGYTAEELAARTNTSNPLSPIQSISLGDQLNNPFRHGSTTAIDGAAQMANAQSGRDLAGGVSHLIRGVGEATAPIALPVALLAAPIPTAVALATGTLAQKGTEAALDGHVAPEYRDLAGDAAGLIAGGVAGHGAGAAADLVDTVGNLPGAGAGGRGVFDLPAKLAGAASNVATRVGDALPDSVGTARDKASDLLNDSAKQNIEAALNPTTKINKKLTRDQLAQGLVDRRVTATSLKGLEEQATGKADALGQKIDDAFDLHAEKGTKLDPAPILEALQHERNDYVVDGVRIDEAYDDILGILQDQLKAVSKANGGEIPVGSLRTIRQILDKKIAKSKGGFALAPDDASRVDALKTYTDAIRGAISDADPTLAALNKEYSFWRNVQKVAGESADRKTGQRAALTQTVLENGGMAAGAALGGGTGAIVGRWLGKATGKLANSTLWNTLSASAKGRVADLLATGDEAAATKVALDPANHAVGSAPAATGATKPLAAQSPATAQSASGSEGPATSTFSPGGSALVSSNGGRGAEQGAAATEAVPGSGGTEADAFPGRRIVGKRAVVALPDGSGLRVRYEIRDGRSVNATHSPVTFAPNAKSRVRSTQPRDYEDPLNHGVVVERATPAVYNHNYSLASDTPSAADGPPIAYDQMDDGKLNGQADAVSGNERHMVNLRMEKMYPEAFERTYGAGLRERLGAYGIDANADLSAVTHPHVFRVVEGRLSPEEMQRVMADTNKSVTKSATPTEQMISDSRRVSPETLNDLAAKVEAFGPDATLSQALEGAAGGEVVQRLIDDGVISKAERGKYIDSDGKITKDGKLRVSGLAIGRFFSDPEQLREVQTSVRNKVERIAAPLVKIENDPDWSLTPRVSAALDLIHRARMRGMDNLQDFVRQDGLFASEKYSPEVIHMAELLRARGNSKELTAGARLYAEDAGFAGGGASLLGDTPTPDRSFEQHFGTPEGGSPQSVKSSKPAAVAVAEKPAAPAAKPAAPAPKSTTGFVEAFSIGKGGATWDLYNKLFAKLQKGDLTELGAPSAVLHAAKGAFDAGKIKSPQDLAGWVAEGNVDKWKAARKAQAAVKQSAPAVNPAAPAEERATTYGRVKSVLARIPGVTEEMIDAHDLAVPDDPAGQILVPFEGADRYVGDKLDQVYELIKEQAGSSYEDAYVKAPVGVVNLHDLHALQNTVSRDVVQQKANALGEGEPRLLPAVAQWNGKLYIVDGNHTLTAKRFAGEPEARVKLFDLDAPQHPAAVDKALSELATKHVDPRSVGEHTDSVTRGKMQKGVAVAQAFERRVTAAKADALAVQDLSDAERSIIDRLGDGKKRTASSLLNKTGAYGRSLGDVPGAAEAIESLVERGLIERARQGQKTDMLRLRIGADPANKKSLADLGK